MPAPFFVGSPRDDVQDLRIRIIILVIDSVLHPQGRTNADVCVDNDAAIGVDVAVVEHKGGAV